MTLAGMCKQCPDELICDFAEYYSVYDWRALPLQTAAVLAIGLSGDSRTKRNLSGENVPTNTLLLAMICDRLGDLIWIKAGAKASNRPRSIVQELISKPSGEKNVDAFDTAEDFWKARALILEGANGN